MEPGTGLVRAMVGGKDYAKSQFNRASQALRSPGSTFKLFVYLTALKEGMKPEDIVVDSPRCFAGYCPKNFGNRYMGAVPLYVALKNSLNVVAVSLLQKLGFDKVIATAKSLGLHRELGRFYPMAIGAYEQTVLDMTAAYAAINNRGVYVTPTPFEEIDGPSGELLWSRRVDGDRGKRVVESDIADAMLWMLQQVVNSGTGGGAALPGRPVAGKTGTSEGGRDLWFIGSIPQLTTGVWLGYDNNRETSSTSVVATYAWHDFMAPIVKDLPVRAFPPKPQLTGVFRPEKPKISSRSDAWSERPRERSLEPEPYQLPPESTPYEAPAGSEPPASNGPSAPSRPSAPAPPAPPAGPTAPPPVPIAPPVAPPPPVAPSAPPPLP
jgi:penicillin-binding protein 1A